MEVSILHGLREVLGENCVDFPRKKVMYHDWSSTKKEDLHGRGFTLYKKPIKDLSKKQRELKNFDYVIYGVSNAYDQQEIKEVNDLVSEENIWHLDGHDLYGHAPRMINFQGENLGICSSILFLKIIFMTEIPVAAPRLVQLFVVCI